jgi:uracil-DNA glycosylase family 4
MINNCTLYSLHLLKTLGIDYIDPVASIDQDSSRSVIDLPSDLSQLNKITSTCSMCDLSKTRNSVVFGEGNINADIMFIGEAPGATEDELGRPFVGRAGELLTNMIEKVLKVKRGDTYIANIVKCRPPSNRVPFESEVNICKNYLLKQIEVISPKIIVTLGKTSYFALTADDKPISTIRGTVQRFNKSSLVPTFHPSYLLRNPSAKKDAYQDMLKVLSILEESR